ncbi:hypothetical protein PR048_012440 [Dryococelus australis]|uniref:Integrase catalytic domain-containing protein n=1 Tax=Dryococelus australis TaxID=614101 RepID=A0ABQ9HPF4_9NEOP|nr:hypothetical protein PR048_012440 [Dryococelus australis]
MLELNGYIPRKRGGKRFLVVVTENFSRRMEAYPTSRASARNVVRVLEEQFFPRLGFPRNLFTDKGMQLMGRKWRDLCIKWDVNHIKMAVCNPRANSMECRNQEIKAQLWLHVGVHHATWTDHIPPILYTLRRRIKATTGRSPTEVLLGHELHLPGKAKSLQQEDSSEMSSTFTQRRQQHRYFREVRQQQDLRVHLDDIRITPGAVDDEVSPGVSRPHDGACHAELGLSQQRREVWQHFRVEIPQRPHPCTPMRFYHQRKTADELQEERSIDGHTRQHHVTNASSQSCLAGRGNHSHLIVRHSQGVAVPPAVMQVGLHLQLLPGHLRVPRAPTPKAVCLAVAFNVATARLRALHSIECAPSRWSDEAQRKCKGMPVQSSWWFPWERQGAKINNAAYPTNGLSFIKHYLSGAVIKRVEVNTLMARRLVWAYGSQPRVVFEVVHSSLPTMKQTLLQHFDKRWPTLTDLMQQMVFSTATMYPSATAVLSMKITNAVLNTVREGQATGEQLTVQMNQGASRYVSTATVQRTLLRMELRSRRRVTIPMLTHVHRQKPLEFARQYGNWTAADWQRVAFSDKSLFQLHRTEGCLHVCPETLENGHPASIAG